MPGPEPPTSRPDASWLEGRGALAFAALLLVVFGLLFLGLVVSGIVGDGRLRLVDAGIAVACLAAAWLVWRFWRGSR